MYAELTGGDVENKQGTEKDKGSQQSTPAGHEDSAVRERMTPPSRAFQLSERPFFASKRVVGTKWSWVNFWGRLVF